MSPSRGLLQRLTTHSFRPLLQSSTSGPGGAPQIYLSLSHNPSFNLSLEHHLFTAIPAETPHLLLYRNTPSIIIGRNQNPWVETAHPLLLHSQHEPQEHQTAVQLLRRRSGGGTVYHDLGNVNYHVSVPTSAFNRDKHAMMVVRALRRIGVSHAIVNKRHDIVITPPNTPAPPAHLQRVESNDDNADALPEGTKKVSGSAYKLTRLRSYHHGTMLLSTDLSAVRGMLRSQISGITRARGVASVSSPVENIGVDAEEFMVAVVEEFQKLYSEGGGAVGIAAVTEAEGREIAEVVKGEQELLSEEWIYGQTPRFELDLPGGNGTLVADKGIVVEVPEQTGEAAAEVVGRRFGGRVVEEVLAAAGYADAEAWARENIGGSEWGRR